MSNRLISVAVGTLVIAASGFAFAADMAVKAPPPAPAPVYSWTGFYVGANIGGGWGSRNVNYAGNDPLWTGVLSPLGATPAPASFNVSGVLGGPQAGYNWQISRSWLIGAETDFDWSGMKGSGSTNPPNFGFFQWTATASEKINWFGTVRARLGYLATENLLTYATGGLAYGRVEHSGSYTNNSNGIFFNGPFGGFSSICNPFSACFVGSASSVATGWTAGGGIEYALWQKWTIKAEYLYVDLGSKSITETATAFNPAFTPSSINANFNHTFVNIVRVGLNYQFH